MAFDRKSKEEDTQENKRVSKKMMARKSASAEIERSRERGPAKDMTKKNGSMTDIISVDVKNTLVEVTSEKDKTKKCLWTGNEHSPGRRESESKI